MRFGGAIAPGGPTAGSLPAIREGPERAAQPLADVARRLSPPSGRMRRSPSDQRQEDLDEKLASLHLAKIGAKLTKMTPEQAKYLGVPQNGPFKAEHYRY